jgi:hypothetical protein
MSVIFIDAKGAYQTDSLFKSDEVIRMELRSDFTTIEAERSGDPVYHEGELIYFNTGGESVKLPVKLIVRGHYRRDTANCNFPPLYVNFKKSEVANTIFRNQNELKLVTPCQDEKDVVDEFLIYKMYNKVTDLSLKVRLVKLLYYDTGTKTKLFEKYSFFIETKDHAAERNNAIVKDLVVTGRDMDRETFNKMSVFEYMIGNDDWYFTFNHNIIIMVPKDSSTAPYCVPYDFDLSAFVNTGYGQQREGRRVYKGLCFTPGEEKQIFDFYKALKPDFEAIINRREEISKGSKKQMINFLGYFYNVIEDPKLIKREFLDACEKSVDYRIKFDQP